VQRNFKAQGGYLDNQGLSPRARKIEQMGQEKAKLTSPGHFRSLAVRAWSHNCGLSLSMAVLRLRLRA
jgi:hypothetical protein